MARPIPRALLIHSATHKYGTLADDGWGNMTHPSSQSLEFVRFEPSSKLVMTKDNNEVQLSAVMFFDCINSVPAGATFAVGDQIVFGDRTYHVETVDTLYDRTLHHYELGLI